MRSVTNLSLARQHYVIQIVITNLKTDKEKELVKQYKDTSAAQHAWRDLVAHV